jgi:gamma-glutamylcyclotransferase (GGCT)/AIG2-like uncharacterized protein YtfP
MATRAAKVNQSRTFQYHKPFVYPAARMAEIAHRYRYSPDISFLQRHETQLLFVCDELMSFHRKHELIVNPANAWSAFTLEPFSMFKKRMGAESYPVPIRERFGEWSKEFGGTGVPWTSIKGEVYAIRPDGHWADIDTWYENGVPFKRERIRLRIPTYRRIDGRIKKREDLCRAWMYVAVPEFWLDMISDFDFKPVRTFVPHFDLDRGPYYYFTKMEITP